LDSRISVGILLRSFARTADKTAGTAERVIKALERVAWYSTPDWRVSIVLVLIPSDRQYKDSDAGELVHAVRRGWFETPVPKAIVLSQEVQADLFVGLQNHAIGFFQSLQFPVDIMITAAPSAIVQGYLSEETVSEIVFARRAGAKAMPVMVPEDGLDEFVARGTAGGPIMAWDLKALIEAGGFDEAAAQPRIGEENANAGTEEIHPLVKIIRQHGPCYAPIQPQGVVIKKRELTGEDLARHQKQIASKTERQLAHARSLGVDGLGFFAEGVMPSYRKK
jgi:hypothetical protein